MREIRKILVPVDFSSHSRRALDEAIGLAKVFRAEIHLLHCCPTIPANLSAAYRVEAPETYDFQVREAAVQRLSEWRSKVRGHKILAEQHITAQPPCSEIGALAKRIGADLIVMGTRGLSGLPHLLLGSVAERTIRTAPCPVLTMKNGGDH